MNKVNIRLIPDKLLGFRLLPPGVIENCLKNTGSGSNSGIERIESKVGSPKPGLASTWSKVGNGKIGTTKTN